MNNRERLRSLVVRVIDSGVIERKYDPLKTYNQYRARLWSAMVRLFDGGRDANFIASFMRTIDEQITEAWNKGAADMGVAPDEMTQDDFAVLEEIINNEHDFIQRILGEIANDRDEGMEREKFDTKYSARADLWANRYNETVNRAHMQIGSKQRLEWKLGATEEHCETCAKLNGIVAFGAEWEAARLHPQMPPNDLLECGGWRCDCSLEPTKKRRTTRALDRMTQITTSRNL